MMGMGWGKCQRCEQLVFRGQKHSCPEEVLKKQRETIEERVFVESSLFDEEWTNYLESQEGKFQEYLARKEREIRGSDSGTV